MYTEFHPRPTQSRQFSGILCRYVYCHYRALHFLWHAIPTLLVRSLFLRIILSLTGIPIALRVVYADRFIRGPFHLGRFSYPIAITAVLWIAFISIVFCLPVLNPVNSQTLNYAPVAVGIVLVYAFGFWDVSARRWFAGPIKQIAGLTALYSIFVDVLVLMERVAQSLRERWAPVRLNSWQCQRSRRPRRRSWALKCAFRNTHC
jgi:hypothetical protein